MFLSLAWLSVSAQALVPITWTAYGLTFEAPKGILVEEDTEETFLLNNSKFYRLSGNFWLVSFKISYLCLPLFYETRTTPSCHPSGCAYRQL